MPNRCDAIFHELARLETSLPKTNGFSPDMLFFVVPGSELRPPYFEFSEAQAQQKLALEDYNRGLAVLKEVFEEYCAEGWPDPLIALDSELVDVFIRAKVLHAEYPDADWTVAAVNATKIHKWDVCSYRHVCQRLSVNDACENNRRAVAWARLPEESIMFTWNWLSILNSRVAQEWFPVLQRPLSSSNLGGIAQEWRCYPCLFENAYLDSHEISEYLIITFGFLADKSYTWKLATVFSAWIRGETIGGTEESITLYQVNTLKENRILHNYKPGAMKQSSGISSENSLNANTLGNVPTRRSKTGERIWWNAVGQTSWSAFDRGQDRASHNYRRTTVNGHDRRRSKSGTRPNVSSSHNRSDVIASNVQRAKESPGSLGVKTRLETSKEMGGFDDIIVQIEQMLRDSSRSVDTRNPSITNLSRTLSRREPVGAGYKSAEDIGNSVSSTADRRGKGDTMHSSSELKAQVGALERIDSLGLESNQPTTVTRERHSLSLALNMANIGEYGTKKETQSRRKMMPGA